MLCAFIVWLNTFVCDMGARPGYEPGTSLTLQLQTVVLRLQKLKQRLRQPPAERDAKSQELPEPGRCTEGTLQPQRHTDMGARAFGR